MPPLLVSTHTPLPFLDILDNPVNIIMHFKEIAFVRLRRDPKVSSVSVDNLMRLRM